MYLHFQNCLVLTHTNQSSHLKSQVDLSENKKFPCEQEVTLVLLDETYKITKLFLTTMAIFICLEHCPRYKSQY